MGGHPSQQRLLHCREQAAVLARVAAAAGPGTRPGISREACQGTLEPVQSDASLRIRREGRAA
eukprot:scaffold7848_cov484-Prasinococcus_capsulatus_cf.AAC.1